MKLCQFWRDKKWPYVFAIFLAFVIAMLTWLMLTLVSVGLTDPVRLSICGGIFLLVFMGMSTYMTRCMRRHFTHQEGIS